MARQKVPWYERRRWTRKDLEELADSPELLRGEIRNHPKALVRISHAVARQVEKQRKTFKVASESYGRNLGEAFEKLLGSTDTKALAKLSEAELNHKRSLFTSVTKVMSALSALSPSKVVNDVGRYVDFMENMADRISGDRSTAWDPNWNWTKFWRVYNEFMAQNPALADMIEGGTNEIQAQLYTTMYSNGDAQIQDIVNELSERLQEQGGLDSNGDLRLDSYGRPVNLSRGISTGSSDKWRKIYGKTRRFP